MSNGSPHENNPLRVFQGKATFWKSANKGTYINVKDLYNGESEVGTGSVRGDDNANKNLLFPIVIATLIS